MSLLVRNQNVTFFPFFIHYIYFMHVNMKIPVAINSIVHMATETTNMFDVSARDRVRGVA